MGPGDPAWLPEDAEYALAWQAEQDNTCGGCGQPRDEALDRDNEGAYEVRLLRCHACAAAERRLDELSVNSDRRGLQTAVHLIH